MTANRWRTFMKSIGLGRLGAAVWLAALLTPFCPASWLIMALIPAWASALALAPGRPQGRRLVGLAFVFLIFWSGLLALTHLLFPSTLRPILNLAFWLALGLNLMLAKTPLEIAGPVGRCLAPVLGRANSQKLALALALLARLIPQLLASALAIRTNVNYRAGGRLPWLRRLNLWGRTLIRDTLAQTDELSRALLKRWPWF